MEQLNKIIDNLPQILLSLGFVLWALARVVEARAKADPKTTWEDEWAPWLSATARLWAQGVDMLAEWKAKNGDASLQTGEAKLKALQEKVGQWEFMWKNGKRKDAITDAFAWYVDLQGKTERLAPPASVPTAGVPAKK